MHNNDNDGQRDTTEVSRSIRSMSFASVASSVKDDNTTLSHQQQSPHYYRQDDAQRRDSQDDSIIDENLVADMGAALLSSPLPDRYLERSERRPISSTRELVRRMGTYLSYFTLLAMLILIPLVLYRALRIRKLDLAAYNSAGVMVCGTIVLSLRLVYLHLTHWYMPEVQKYVVRILWMVPIYAVQSWLSLIFRDLRIYIDTFRDFYEAYVIASFVYYLIELLGGEDALVHILELKPESLGEHTFPLNQILDPWPMGMEFMLQCKHGVLQYVVFKTVSTLVTYLCESMEVYGEGKFEWRYAYPYLCFLQNVSVMYALYCLVMLFHAVNEELRSPVNWRPLGKFLCIKGVVFFTWWQGVVIFYLRAHGIIGSSGSWSSEEIANGLIDYCIVIEMVGFAIAHSYTFTYTEYLPSNIPSGSVVAHLLEREASAVSDCGGNDGSIETDEDGNPTSPQYRRATYCPPATLHQPMRFREAFWSSTLPKETLKDIQQLRAGVDGVLLEATRERSISLLDLKRKGESSQGSQDIEAVRGGDVEQSDGLQDDADNNSSDDVPLIPPRQQQQQQQNHQQYNANESS